MVQNDETQYIARILDGDTECFSAFLDRYSRPLYVLIAQIVAIAQGMIPVSPCQGFHNGRMHTRIIIRGKTSHSVLKINYSAKEENYSQKKKDLGVQLAWQIGRAHV